MTSLQIEFLSQVRDLVLSSSCLTSFRAILQSLPSSTNTGSMSGTVQLSKRVRSSLLSTFRTDEFKTSMDSTVKEPENIEDLPVSSDDDDQPSLSEQPFVDSSDDDVNFGNIKRTHFKWKADCKLATTPGITSGPSSTAKEKDSAGLAQHISQQRSTRSSKAQKRLKDDIEDENEDKHDRLMPKKTRTSSDDLAGEVGDHMSSETLLFTKSTASRRYGKNSTSHPKLQTNRYTDWKSPKKEVELKSKYAAISSSPVSLRGRSQPLKTEGGKMSNPSDDSSSENRSDPPRALQGRKRKRNPVQRAGKNGTRKAIEFSPEPMSQKPQLKIPDAYNNYAPSAALVDLDNHVDDESTDHERQLDPGMALCPICDEQVDQELLKQFSNGERMKLVRQVKFCRMHKKSSAQKTWEEKGYPVIDWAKLQERVKGHQDFLKSIIMGTGSHFGDILQENIRTGKARTLLTTKEYLTPGYYGLRGMSIMTETVTDTFSNLLRKRAPLDTRISGRGYTGFVQSVLVPELAVKLIQEDLSLGEDQARLVMEDSRVVGEILNDERQHSQSHARRQVDEESQDEQYESSNCGSNDTASVNLEIEQAADRASDLSSPPFYSQRPTSARVPEADDSESNESLASLGAMKTKVPKMPVEKEDVTTFPTRASPSKMNTRSSSPAQMEDDDSDDLSSLPSL